MDLTNGRGGPALLVALIVVLTGSRAWAFDPIGHDTIEAAAYRRLLATAEVPGAGISGRTLLAALMTQKVLVAPPCFGEVSTGGCSLQVLREAPLAAWPRLGSGAADLLIDRQLDEAGQCQHFMAQTVDGLSPIDPRLGVPAALAGAAYTRCIGILALVLDGIVRHPRLASWRVAGIYVLMHAIEDSFSEAHAHRSDQGGIVYLLSWKLLDWPRYLVRGRSDFPPATHHGFTDPRDAAYLLVGARSAEGQPCDAFPQPYAVPEECLSRAARAAVAAIVDLLVLTYTLRARGAAEGRVPSLESPQDGELWRAYVRQHLSSTTVEIELPHERREPPPRPDLFVGVLGAWRPGGWGAGLWGSRFFFGPGIPFAIGPFVGGAFTRGDEGTRLAAAFGLSLYLPVARRLALGFSPAGVQVTCTTDFGHCAAEGRMTVGNLVVPLGPIWVSLQGPSYSWSERRFRDSRLALAVGWWHEKRPREAAIGARSPLGWSPPAPGEVSAYRLRRTTSFLYLAASAASTAQDQTVGVALAAFRDRDRWDRRAGIGPGLSLQLDWGRVGGVHTTLISVAPLARVYMLPDRLALVVAPAVMRVRPTPAGGWALDLAGRVGVALALDRIEVTVDGPPLSYLSTQRWAARPFSVGLGLLLN
jgi:hypothetical protein